MSILNRLVLILVFIGSVGCAPVQDEPGSKTTGKDYFFDIRSYIEQETARLASENKKLEKTIWIGEQKETKVLDSVDWKEELRLFSDSDINRPAWTEKYEGDTLLADPGRVRTIHYKAVDPGLRVQQLTVTFDSNGIIDQLEVKKTLNSLIERIDQYLIYQPESGYELQEKSESSLNTIRDVRIKAQFQ